MNILSLLTYTAFLIYLSFAIYILYLDFRGRLNRIFFLMSLSLAIWSIADTFYYTAGTKETAMIFWRLSTIGWILSPSLMLHLMLIISKNERFIDRYPKLIVLYLPGVVLEYLALTTNFYLKDIYITPLGWADLIDFNLPVTKLFLIYYLSYCLIGLIAVYIYGQKTEDIVEKRQSAVIFITSLLALFLSFLSNTLQIAFENQMNIPAFAEVFILIWVFGIIYSIKRFDFLTKKKEISKLTEQVKIQEWTNRIQNEYIKRQRYLSHILFDFIGSKIDNDIYEYIADRIYLLGDIKLLIITEFSTATKEFILKTLRAEPQLREEFLSIIKERLPSQKIRITDDNILNHLLSAHIIKIEGGLYESILRTIDRDTIDALAKKYNLKEAFVIGFSASNRLFGAATIILEEGKTFRDIEFVEVLINALSLILQKHLLDIQITKSELQYRTIFENSEDVIYILNSNGRIISLSPSCERITGYRIEDLINRPMSDIIHPDDINKAFDMQNKIINEGISERQTIRIISKDGGIIYGEFAGKRIKLDDGSYGLLGVGRDVTERIKNEEMIRSYQRELELKTAKIETTGLMAAGVLHDLNNIIMNISSRINTIKRCQIPDPTLAEQIDEIEKTISIAERISRSLLNISGGKSFEREEIPLSKLIIENLSLIVRDKRYKLKTSIIEQIPEVGLSHPQIIQIINNLVINSIQAMPSGGEIEVIITKERLSEKEYLKIIVVDTGPGIPDEIKEKVFDPFFTTKEEGTGLGLYIVKTLINSCKGKIEVKSTEGKGTMFTIYIPLREKTGDFHNEHIEGAERNKRELKNILIIDDEETIRELTKDMLSHLGFNAIASPDIRDGINKIKELILGKERIDATILDLHLREAYDPVEVLKRIKSIDPEIRVIICSGSPQDPFIRRYTSYGFDAVLSKPFNLNTLKNALK
jgi:PAS domain S-box-containing protein